MSLPNHKIGLRFWMHGMNRKVKSILWQTINETLMTTLRTFVIIRSTLAMVPGNYL